MEDDIDFSEDRDFESSLDSLVVGLCWLSNFVSIEVLGWTGSVMLLGFKKLSWFPFNVNLGVPLLLEFSLDFRTLPSKKAWKC